MIKRRFYRLEHGDKDEASSDSSSSSSSDSDVEAESSDESAHDATAEDVDQQDVTSSASSGYESEESSAAEVNEDTSDSEIEDDSSEDDKQTRISAKLSGRPYGKPLGRQSKNTDEEESEPVDDMPDCVLQVKSVYRCRICPRIICLTDQTMRVHLKSKRHARSEKQLKENRLKTALNSDGEMENQETPAEMNARIVALAEEKTKRKNTGRQRQRNRLRKKKTGDDTVVGEKKTDVVTEKNKKESTEGLTRKRLKK